MKKIIVVSMITLITTACDTGNSGENKQATTSAAEKDTAGGNPTYDLKLVGPGWKGVTARHTPEWIMNFATNPDAMLAKDPKAQAMLEICLVRMPNQNLTDEDARNIYEFMRKNDGVK
jgi:hypothetical protein